MQKKKILRASSSMKKNKILLVAPYGMTLRQVVLNEDLWKYLSDNFEIHVKTFVQIKDYRNIGVNELIYPKKNLLYKFVSLFYGVKKNLNIFDFLIENEEILLPCSCNTINESRSAFAVIVGECDVKNI